MTTLNQQAMGGNGAYIASEGGVPMRESYLSICGKTDKEAKAT